jgi:hypothetical protein
MSTNETSRTYRELFRKSTPDHMNLDSKRKTFMTAYQRPITHMQVLGQYSTGHPNFAAKKKFVEW